MGLRDTETLLVSSKNLWQDKQPWPALAHYCNPLRIAAKISHGGCFSPVIPTHDLQHVQRSGPSQTRSNAARGSGQAPCTTHGRLGPGSRRAKSRWLCPARALGAFLRYHQASFICSLQLSKVANLQVMHLGKC